MADFTKTITNSINLFGLNPSSKWGQTNYPYTMVWGTTKWGEGTFAQIFNIEKLIENSVLPDNTVTKEVQHVIENTLTLTEDMDSEVLSNGIWSVVFPDRTTEAEDRVTTSWSESSDSTTSFSCLPAGSTTWS